MSDTEPSKFEASAASISRSMKGSYKSYNPDPERRSTLAFRTGPARSAKERTFDSKGRRIKVEFDEMRAEDDLKGLVINREDHLKWFNKLESASGGTVAKEILKKAGVTKVDKSQYQLGQLSIRFDQVKTELPKPDNVTASIYVRLQADTAMNKNLPPETPTASLNPVRLEAELEPYGSGWGIKSTRVATWAEEDAEPEPDSKAWTTLFEDCKE